MSSWIDACLNRLAMRLWQLVSAKVAAQVEVQVAQTLAELLEQAATFRRGHGKIGEQVARRLEAVCERLVREISNDLSDAELPLAAQAAMPADGHDAPAGNSSGSVDAAGKRPRGRPRKDAAAGLAAPAGDIFQSGSDDSDEVTHEERTGARHPAGADQVPDLSA